MSASGASGRSSFGIGGTGGDAIVGAVRRDVDMVKAYRVVGVMHFTRARPAPQIWKRIPSMPTTIPEASTAARSRDDSMSIGFVLLMCV